MGTDTYLFELSGCDLLKVQQVDCSTIQPSDGKVKISVVLDRTIFHPQGGGQPADIGTLSAEGLPDLSVVFTSASKDDGSIFHDCNVSESDKDAWIAMVGKVKVVCRIDQQNRLINARLHSAGHLLDAAVNAAGVNWKPGKGYHFPAGAYVEYVLSDESWRWDPKNC